MPNAGHRALATLELAGVVSGLITQNVDLLHTKAGSRDVVELVRAGDTRAVRMVREAGRSLGEVLAACVNFFNPAVIVIGGDLGHVHEQLLAGIREVTFQRSLPLATQHLSTVPARLGDRAGIIGAAIMAIEHALAPEVIDRELQEGVAA